MNINPDLKYALRNIGTMAALFLLIVLVAQAEKNFLIVLTSTLVGAGAPIILGAFEKKKTALKAIIGWGVIGLAAGIGFAAAI